MAKIIRYVTGIPKGKAVEPKEFEEFRKDYELDKENVDVRKYSGPLTREDFSALNEIFYSDQFRELKGDRDKFLERLRIAIGGEQPLTKTSYSSETGKPYRSKHVANIQEVSRVSGEFFGELERAIREIGMPTCAVEALDFVLKNAEDRGLYVPISYSYPTNKIEDLSCNTEVLVFIDEKPEGKIWLRKTRAYDDQWAGYTEEGKIFINVFGQEKITDWNSWQGNSLRWIVDPIIRKQILGEKEGVIFTRLL